MRRALNLFVNLFEERRTQRLQHSSVVTQRCRRGQAAERIVAVVDISRESYRFGSPAAYGFPNGGTGTKWSNVGHLRRMIVLLRMRVDVTAQTWTEGSAFVKDVGHAWPIPGKVKICTWRALVLKHVGFAELWLAGSIYQLERSVSDQIARILAVSSLSSIWPLASEQALAYALQAWRNGKGRRISQNPRPRWNPHGAGF